MKRTLHNIGFSVRKKRFTNPRSFIFVLSIIIGIIGGLSAVLLKNLVHLTGQLVYSDQTGQFHYWSIILPGVGILLTVLFTTFIAKDNLSHGVAKVLAAIAKDSSRIKRHNTYTSVIASSLTVGFGGSVGLEAPVVYTGAAIGTNIAERFNLNYKLRTLCIACGSAAAIAGIFKAPIAATIFALEVLMIDLSMWSIVPLLLASVSGAMVSYFLMGDSVSFSFALFDHFDKTKIPFYAILGILCGLFSLYFTWQSRRIEHAFSKIKNRYIKIAWGGLGVGILIFLFPPLFGEGYITLQNLLGGIPENTLHNSLFNLLGVGNAYFTIFLLCVLLLKVFASSLTNGAGGVGGVFAPSLFMGGIAGFVFSHSFNKLNWVQLSEHNFALVGMAGVMSAIMHAPLTSIFLIAEITGGYNLFLPLIITSSIAYLIKSYFDKHSIYTYNLAKKTMPTN